MSRDWLIVYLVAGEPSGDVLGGSLMAALKTATGGAVEFRGIGGPAMQEQGLKSQFPMSELSVMGLISKQDTGPTSRWIHGWIMVCIYDH